VKAGTTAQQVYARYGKPDVWEGINVKTGEAFYVSYHTGTVLTQPDNEIWFWTYRGKNLVLTIKGGKVTDISSEAAETRP